MIELNRQPSQRDLAIFGWLLAAFTLIVGTIAWLHWQSMIVAGSIWTVGGSLSCMFFACPSSRRRIYLGWMYAAFPIGWTMSHVLLAVVYFVIVTPVGLAMRLVSGDPLRRRLQREAVTYWQPRSQPRNVTQYFRQF